ncbi:MAG TPA: Maf family protein [Thermomicrobiales bacterium]|nr:Maf family protein [Thermomicrobiales bacterium]
MPHRPIVLASSSPRRRVLLGELGVRFTVRISDLDEGMTAPAEPAAYVASLARQKAQIVAWEALPDTVEVPADLAPLVIGADTVVVLDDEILGKPTDAGDADRMLRRLRGRSHQVMTAVALIDTIDRSIEVRTVSSDVHMADFRDDDLAAYIATGEPLDKAGGYGIQRGTAHLITGFSGCYTTIVGFPVCEVASLLLGAGITLRGEAPYCRLPDGRPCPHELAMSSTRD